jgi:hypothetical protein
LPTRLDFAERLLTLLSPGPTRLELQIATIHLDDQVKLDIVETSATFRIRIRPDGLKPPFILQEAHINNNLASYFSPLKCRISQYHV